MSGAVATELSGWGRTMPTVARLVDAHSETQISELIKDAD